MSWPASAGSLELPVEPGLRLCAAVATVHLLIVLASLELGWAPRLVVWLVLAGSLGYWSIFALWPASPWRIRRLQRAANGDWSLELGNGRRLAARLLGDSFVHPRLTILTFATGAVGRRSVVLLSQRGEPASFRRLRVLLAAQRLSSTH